MEKLLTTKFYYLLLLLLTARLTAQENLSLEQAFEIALQQNFGIRVARNQTAISENSASLGNAGLLPSINASAGLLNTDFDGYQNNLPVTAVTTKTATGVSLSYTLFSGLSRIYGYRSLREQVNSAELQERLTVENTLLGVAQAYFNLAAAGENLAIADNQLQLSRERRSLSQERMTLGSLGRIDYLSAQVDFNADSLSFLSARQTHADASRDLNLLLGREPDRQYTVEPDDSPFTRYDQGELRESALSNNGTLNLAGSALELSQLNLKSGQSSFLPQISYTASYGSDQTAADWGIGLDNPNSALTHNFSLGWSLFNGGTKKTQLQNAKINVKNAELRQAETRLNIERDVASYHSAYENSLIALESELKTLEFAELNFDRTREMFRLGQITALQYREAQLNLGRTKLAITRSHYTARVLELKLLQLSGRLL